MTKFVALHKIGEFEKGDIIPEAQARLWLKMYKVPCVEIVEEMPKEQPKAEAKVEFVSAEEKEDDSLAEEIEAIKGIGKKTVKDILAVAKTRKALEALLKSKDEVPFRDDVVKKLKEVFLK